MEELYFLIGESDIQVASSKLYDMGIKLVLVTLGKDGCYYKHSSGSGQIPAFHVDVVDTTGAGDGFLGGILYNISRIGYPIEKINRSDIEEIIRFSNAIGGLCTTKKGAIPAMPSMDEVKKLLS
ncbi:MAG: PfkB family carbohydrate kinase [Thermoanaerobacterium sp.]|nr:PfkB family carbohydrate kinase [Thermoanaerobacterium sp.]